MRVLADGGLSLCTLLVLDERVGDVVLFLLEDEGLDDSELAELAANVFLLDLR